MAKNNKKLKKSEKSQKSAEPLLYNSADAPDVSGNSFKIGDIVLALAGRDEERLFVVVGILDKDYVLIANGRSRRVDSPKKKKIRHIKLVKESGSDFIEIIERAEKSGKLKGGRFSNLILRNIINQYIQNNQDNQNNQIEKNNTAKTENI